MNQRNSIFSPHERRRFRLRATPFCAALFALAMTALFSAPARTHRRMPSIAPQTTGSAAAVTASDAARRSRRQSLLPARIPPDTTDTSNTDNPTKPTSGREELDPEVERERQRSLAAYMNPLMNNLMSELRVPGAVLAIVRRDRVYLLQGYGYGELTGRARVDAIRTRFPVGQISALVTAAAVLHAIDRGQLDRNVPADAYLTDALPRPLGKSITINDLLLRNSGLAALSENGGFASRGEAPGLRDYIRRKQPAFRRRDTGPSDYEFNLLGYILERSSRLAFADHLNTFFFRGLGMNASGYEFLGSRSIPDGEARPYAYGDEAYTALPVRLFAPAPALGLSTTGSDMARLLVMLSEEGRFGQARLLSETNAKRMLDTTNDDRFLRPTYYYGLQPLEEFETSTPGLPAARRGLVSYGDLPGYSAVVCFIPSREMGLFLATNSHSPELREKVLRGFLERFAFR